jgi:hypothetical protein
MTHKCGGAIDVITKELLHVPGILVLNKVADLVEAQYGVIIFQGAQGRCPHV